MYLHADLLIKLEDKYWKNNTKKLLASALKLHKHSYVVKGKVSKQIVLLFDIK